MQPLEKGAYRPIRNISRYLHIFIPVLPSTTICPREGRSLIPRQTPVIFPTINPVTINPAAFNLPAFNY
jgi:hypothetical protein